MLFVKRFPISTRVLFVAAAIAVAILAHLTGIDAVISEEAHTMGPAGAFLVGMFYTFGLTTPTAFMVLIEMMLLNDWVPIALTASLAAAGVDAALFMVFKKELERSAGRLMAGLHARFGRHSAVFSLVGLFLFGSPLPDELALAMMQISDIRPARIFFVVFFAKFVTLTLVFAGIQSAGV